MRTSCMGSDFGPHPLVHIKRHVVQNNGLAG
jgi:hypothetical protein